MYTFFGKFGVSHSVINNVLKIKPTLHYSFGKKRVAALFFQYKLPKFSSYAGSVYVLELRANSLFH